MNNNYKKHLSNFMQMVEREVNKDEIKENKIISNFEDFLSEKVSSVRSSSENESHDIETTVEDVLLSITQIEPILEEVDNTSIGPIQTAIKTNDQEEKQYATLDDLRTYYSTFLAKIQQQMYGISAGSSGGGEVNFRYLDDVLRETIGDTDKILRYDPLLKKFFFGQLSGDQGPIRSLTFDLTGEGVEKVPGMLSWNQSEDCLDIVQNDGSVLQTGLEMYVQVINNSPDTYANGTVVELHDVNGGNQETLIGVPMAATEDAKPLVVIGILTNSILSGQVGRATTFGKVRNLNTTGSDVGEVWSIGDVLYVHPTIPGKMTNVKPTAPSPVISIAAVLRVDTSIGILFVRPTIWPRLYYGSFSSNVDQFAALPDTAYPVNLEITTIASGHTTGTPNSRIVAGFSGLYRYHFSAQVLSSNASEKNVYFWGRKNGVDIDFSTKTTSVVGNSIYDIISFDFILSMQKDDYFELMWATSDITAHIAATPPITFAPSSPSVTITVSEIAP